MRRTEHSHSMRTRSCSFNCDKVSVNCLSVAFEETTKLSVLLKRIC